MKKNNPTKKLPPKAVKSLFERFMGIWGTDWVWRIQGNELSALKEWAEVLGEFNDTQIEHAIKIARVKFPKPITLHDFYELCKGAQNGTLITFGEAIELAEQKLRKKFKPNGCSDLDLERDLLVELRLRLYQSQNAEVDIVFCNSKLDICRNYIFVTSSTDTSWFCQIHEEK